MSDAPPETTPEQSPWRFTALKGDPWKVGRSGMTAEIGKEMLRLVDQAAKAGNCGVLRCILTDWPEFYADILGEDLLYKVIHAREFSAECVDVVLSFIGGTAIAGKQTRIKNWGSAGGQALAWVREKHPGAVMAIGQECLTTLAGADNPRLDKHGRMRTISTALQVGPEVLLADIPRETRVQLLGEMLSDACRQSGGAVREVVLMAGDDGPAAVMQLCRKFKLSYYELCNLDAGGGAGFVVAKNDGVSLQSFKPAVHYFDEPHVLVETTLRGDALLGGLLLLDRNDKDITLGMANALWRERIIAAALADKTGLMMSFLLCSMSCSIGLAGALSLGLGEWRDQNGMTCIDYCLARHGWASSDVERSLIDDEILTAVARFPWVADVCALGQEGLTPIGMLSPAARAHYDAGVLGKIITDGEAGGPSRM